MVQHIVDFEFFRELLHHIVLLDRWFEYLLECQQETSAFVPANMDISKLSRSHALSQLEVSHPEVFDIESLWLRTVFLENFLFKHDLTLLLVDLTENWGLLLKIERFYWPSNSLQLLLINKYALIKRIFILGHRFSFVGVVKLKSINLEVGVFA